MYLTFQNKNIEIYFNEIRSNESLTKEEEIILFTRISRGDQTAEKEVFNRMTKLAVAVAKTYTGDPDLLEDLIQEANIGILTAIKKFDPSTGNRFSTYARWWMKANITTFLNDMGIVHPANHRIPDLAKKIRETFFKTHHRDITEFELLDRLEEMGEMVGDINAIQKVMVTRIDLPIDDEDLTSADCGEFASRTAVENDYEKDIRNEDLSYDIAKRLSRLSPREQAIIRMKFGFATGYEMDYKGIAETWNNTHPNETLTVERIRQICVGALAKMK